MDKVEDARKLAKAMVDIGNSLGRQTMAVISDMNQPLGRLVGNALEVKEAIDTLKGEGPEDLHELCLTLGSHMVVLGGKADTVHEARTMLEQVIQNGKALEKMKTFIEAQGGDPASVERPETLVTASSFIEVKADTEGFVHRMDAALIGRAAMVLGAGRATKEDKIDHAVGVELVKKIGDSVKHGETLAVLHTNKDENEAVKDMINRAYEIEEKPASAPSLIYDTIE